MPNFMCNKIIYRHNNNLLANCLKINKTTKLVIKKYFKLIIYKKDIEIYIKGYNIYLI